MDIDQFVSKNFMEYFGLALRHKMTDMTTIKIGNMSTFLAFVFINLSHYLSASRFFIKSIILFKCF
ncbi:hypothetical protein C9993_09415 [Marinobacter sp. Z-F4-2]|nr:hypothetical protein C9993_09415 [Marinobacter sp. Z-F4-2]